MARREEQAFKENLRNDLDMAEREEAMRAKERAEMEKKEKTKQELMEAKEF
jgi:hypothetical protein